MKKVIISINLTILDDDQNSVDLQNTELVVETNKSIMRIQEDYKEACTYARIILNAK